MAATLILTQQNRQGTFTTASIALPAEVDSTPTVGREVAIRVITTTADYEDTRNSLQFNLYRSADSGATWQHVAGIGWTGGRFVGKDGAVNPPPDCIVGPIPAEWVGQRFRAELDIPRRMSAGAEIEVL